MQTKYSISLPALKRLFGCGALLFLITSGLAFAQTTGKIIVSVTDEAGDPLPGAMVLAESTSSITKRNIQTNARGEAFLNGLPPANNWVVTVTFHGFQTVKNENVRVRGGQVVTLNVPLRPAELNEIMQVVSEAPMVDVTSSITGQEITLELTEALPTSRSYQGFLQLVPSTTPTITTNGEPGDPASRSGANFSDAGNRLGGSTDNYYYIEGINTNDNITGSFGSNLNTEIIQEMNVHTGGLPAEYIGSAGLVSNITTKEGGNDFSGSLNYFFQSDALVETNEHAEDASFSTFDTAFTFGGPIIKDKLWFFTSARLLEREADVTTNDTNEFLRTVTREQEQLFAKLSWQITEVDKLTGVFFNDPTTIDGSFNTNRTNARNFARETGGDNFTLKYERAIGGSGYLDVSLNSHESALDDLASIQEIQNTVSFLAGDSNLSQQQLGGFGSNDLENRKGVGLVANMEWMIGSHTLKGGYEYNRNENFRSENYVGGAQYTSIASQYGGVNAGDLRTQNWTATNFSTASTADRTGFLNGLSQSANLSSHLNAMGLSSLDELAAMDVNDQIALLDQVMVFNSTAGNPNDQINYYRIAQTTSGDQTTKNEGSTMYLQDNMVFGDWTVNAGVRAEQWKHLASTGEEIFTFDWELAPRLSVAWDIGGEGKQRISAYYGRYFDPIKGNITNFAGSLSGRTREEQLFFNGEWVNFRTRGGPSQLDAAFAPNTKTPYTDEIQVSYARDLGNNMSFEATAYRRETRDIFEDFDLGLYALAPDGTTYFPGDINAEGSLWLGLDYFGLDENPGANYLNATLPNGKRDFEGLEMVFRKRFSNNWQTIASYSYTSGKGNTYSDGDADLGGDYLELDPRAPGVYGDMPGIVAHNLKFSGSYRFDMGLEIGGSYRWNSGLSDNLIATTEHGRGVPQRADAYTFNGATHTWLVDNAVGTLDNPSYGTLDVRFEYNFAFMDRYKLEAFVDVFNVADDQATVRNSPNLAGTGATAFGQGVNFVQPRRFFLGARLGF